MKKKQFVSEKQKKEFLEKFGREFRIAEGYELVYLMTQSWIRFNWDKLTLVQLDAIEEDLKWQETNLELNVEIIA